MKRVVFVAVLAGIVLLPASGAYADTVEIGLGFNGGAVIPITSGSGSISIGPASLAGWTISALALGTPPNPEPLLESLTVEATDTSGGLSSLQVYVTEVGLSSPLGVNTFLSGFTSNFITPGVTSVVESTYVDTANGAFALTSPLSSFTFSGPITVAQSHTLGATTPSLGAPYSETEVFNILASGTGTTSDTITVSSAVPEPGTLTLFGSGLVGLASLLRRKLARA